MRQVFHNLNRSVLMFKDFYDVLIENLSNYEGVYASFIDYGPKLFRLLCDLFEEESITEDDRLKLSAAISYFIIPTDIIPEQVHGPYGYIDDIFIIVYVLRKIADAYGYDLLQKTYMGFENIQEVMDECFENSLDVLSEKQINSILSYVGLNKK